jgi:hypothetical protein
MENRASKTRSLNIAFVVDEELLRRLEVVLTEVSKALEYTVKYSDGTTVHYSDIEDIIKQPNVKPHSIISVTAAADDSNGQSGYIILRAIPPSSPSVEYTINGSQRNVIYVADQLDDWIAALRQWFSPFRTSILGSGLITIGALFGPMLLIFIGFEHFFPQMARSNTVKLSVLVGLLISMVPVYAIEVWIFMLFPRATFAIGQGAKRHQLFVYLRYGVLGAFVLSIIASLLANLIMLHF